MSEQQPLSTNPQLQQPAAPQTRVAINDPAYPYPYQDKMDVVDHVVVNTPRQFRVFADSRPIGWGAFAVALFVLGFHTGAISLPFGSAYDKMTVDMTSLAVGGVGMLVAAIWCFPNNDTFLATFFGLYGAFFLALGVSGADFNYAPTASISRPLRHSEATYYLVWVLVNLGFWMASVRQSIVNIVLTTFLELTWILLCSGTWTGRKSVVKAGGYFAFFSSLCALYLYISTMFRRERFWVRLPVGHYQQKSVV